MLFVGVSVFSSVKLKSQTIPIPTIDSVTVASNNQVRMAGMWNMTLV